MMVIYKFLLLHFGRYCVNLPFQRVKKNMFQKIFPTQLQWDTILRAVEICHVKFEVIYKFSSLVLLKIYTFCISVLIHFLQSSCYSELSSPYKHQREHCYDFMTADMTWYANSFEGHLLYACSFEGHLLYACKSVTKHH